MFVSKEVQLGRNKYFIGGEGNDLFEALQALNLVKSVHNISKCGICGGDNLSFSSHKAQDKFKYCTVRCNEPTCGGVLNISENATTGQRYYRKDSEGKFEWKEIAKKEK